MIGGMESNFTQEQQYLKARKKAKEIKGFYVHLIVNIFCIPIIVTVNLMFVPGFHFFWLAIGGILISIIIHWLIVFGFDKFNLGKEWEEKKIKELIQQDNKRI